MKCLHNTEAGRMEDWNTGILGNPKNNWKVGIMEYWWSRKKSKSPHFVIPAKARIQLFQIVLDSRWSSSRWKSGLEWRFRDFLRFINIGMLGKTRKVKLNPNPSKRWVSFFISPFWWFFSLRSSPLSFFSSHYSIFSSLFLFPSFHHSIIPLFQSSFFSLFQHSNFSSFIFNNPIFFNFI